MRKAKSTEDVDYFAGGCLFTFILIGAAGAIGWVMNVGKLVAGIADPISLLTILRIIGIPFFPLGWVIGWF